jgi:hypothetical protein
VKENKEKECRKKCNNAVRKRTRELGKIEE